MAAFINNDITTAGLIVLAKGVAGQKINYTKIVLGDGYLEEGQTPRTLTGVVSPKATVDITKLKINGDETEGFYYRELGLYAEDPDPEVGEVLYCYGNCGDLAEWIPPSGGATIVEKTIDIVTAIGTATNVTAYIPADAYAHQRGLRDLQGHRPRRAGYGRGGSGARPAGHRNRAGCRGIGQRPEQRGRPEHQQDRNAVGRRFQRDHDQPLPDHVCRPDGHHPDGRHLEQRTPAPRVLNYRPKARKEAAHV